MEMNGTTIIKQPVETIEAYVMDLSNDKNWRTGLEESGWNPGQSLEVGAVGYVRVGDDKAEWKIIAYTPGESVDWEFLNGPIAGRGGYRFVPVDGGTEFTLVADVKPTNWFKYLGPIFGWVGQRQNQADVEKLRDILEAEPA